MASPAAGTASGGDVRALMNAAERERCLTGVETREAGAGAGCVTPSHRSAAIYTDDNLREPQPGAAHNNCMQEAAQTNPPFSPRPSALDALDARESAVTSAPPPSSSVLFTPTLLAATTPGGMLSPTNNKRKRIESTRPKPGSAHSGRSRPFSAATAPASGAPKRKGSSDFLRKGQWTVAEEKFARALIEAFQDGYLPIFSGVRLRGYLAVQLQCDPMRISKKLCGGSVDGKQVPRNFGQNKFKLRKKQMWDQAVAARVLAELEQLMHDLWCESGIPRPSYLTLSSTRTPGDDPFFSLGGYVDSVAGPQGAAARVGRSELLSDCAASSSGSSSPVSRRPLDAPAFPIIYLNLAKKRKKDGDSAARGGCLTVGAPPPTLRATSDGSRAEYKKLAGGAARAAGGWKVDGDSLQAAYELLHLLQAHPDDA